MLGFVYVPLIVFSFLHQPTDAVCLIPLLQELGERPIECGLPTLNHAAVLLHGIRCLAVGYADVLLPLPDELVSPQIHPVVFADVLEHPDNEDGLSVVP